MVNMFPNIKCCPTFICIFCFAVHSLQQPVAACLSFSEIEIILSTLFSLCKSLNAANKQTEILAVEY